MSYPLSSRAEVVIFDLFALVAAANGGEECELCGSFAGVGCSNVVCWRLWGHV